MTLRFASRNGRAHLVVGADHRLVDLETVSGGKFSSEPIDAFRRWKELRAFAATVPEDSGDICDVHSLDAPSPWPTQVFGIGLNYRSHAEESGLPIPTSPLTFAKYSSSIAHGDADIPLGGSSIDWEVELVVVIADGGRTIAHENAWDHVAGIAVGQDISDRALQFASQPPQFSLGKSRKNYSPFGPWLIDAADVPERDALHMTCTLNGETVQDTSTDDLIFSVSDIISYLSEIVQLLPGDVIYTGTPGGVGVSRQPAVFLKPGDVLVSTIDGIGTTTNRCIAE
jgi:2-keto-4-pentenoate hydratase/2-oxohepta-3-ene-1,7-dioic acid hydratase in catechol pathway